ncbi:helix-turn-helix domain-containing protein [Chryseobacterium daecheongense]|uniref:AraC family transcriptional regulator n=1 Tax=Chryseobacterium daecheongense TaxID=192389 RepID=A0A3N0W669_9FLAO|nr:helix-turn-helix domain-containing protein [Chryseobacterium daecheongense]ROI00271.1 AraC family transcriptional regulator [Chryseobacterium daecheongense]TDX94770.1 helix-turn-helix protein [Chryseobacterium daecheongense]
MIDKSVPKKEIQYYKSISDLCKALGVRKPAHPLIVIINHDEISSNKVRYLVHDFYMISYKSNLKGKLKYGQGYYDFDEGGLIFVAPNQALSVIDDDECRGRSIFIHPDFFAGHPLFKSITKHGFFGYNINEALHLSERERDKILHVFEDINDELETSIDDTSQELIISYIEVLLNYSNRYYKRQFITRKAVNSPVIEKFEALLNNYYVTGLALENGIPSVKYFSDQLNVSSGYLSDLLRSLTGLNSQQHIHAKLIEVAKQKLSTSELTAAEIAYELGFEYPQSFNKLFKNKTGMTPLEFREHLN